MRRQGFTLAELMGVIVILSIIAIIIVPTVEKNLQNSKTITCESQEKSILEAAKNYLNNNIASCAVNKGEVCNVTVYTLVQNGFIEGTNNGADNMINPATDNPYDKNTYVQIYNATGYNYSYTLIYEGKDKNTCD
jgi:prepilin-type N-terminal cleavage/methylation domain-containing protein